MQTLKFESPRRVAKLIQITAPENLGFVLTTPTNAVPECTYDPLWIYGLINVEEETRFEFAILDTL